MDTTVSVQSHLRAAAVWCLCAALAVVQAACPDNAMMKAMMCTSELGLGPPSPVDNAFVDRGQTEVAKQACRDNKLSMAVDCLEEITQACQGSSDQEHFLRNMIDVSRTRQHITFFCSHLDEYDKEAPCIARLHPTLTECVAKERQNMEIKVKASSNMDFLMTATCKYFHAAEVCADRVLSRSCSASATQMVSRVFLAFKPPLCDSVTFTSSRSGSSSGESSGGEKSASTGSAASSLPVPPTLPLTGLAMWAALWR